MPSRSTLLWDTTEPSKIYAAKFDSILIKIIECFGVCFESLHFEKMVRVDMKAKMSHFKLAGSSSYREFELWVNVRSKSRRNHCRLELPRVLVTGSQINLFLRF